MTKVVVTNGNVDGALRKFKVKVARSGVPSELKKRKHYEKPGVKRREAKKEMLKIGEKNNIIVAVPFLLTSLSKIISYLL